MLKGLFGGKGFAWAVVSKKTKRIEADVEGRLHIYTTSGVAKNASDKLNTSLPANIKSLETEVEKIEAELFS